AEIGASDLELTSAELRILELLVRADARTVSRDELMTQALGRRLLPTDRSLDTHVSNLCRKLQKHTDRVTLQSVRGSGYALTLVPGGREMLRRPLSPSSSGAKYAARAPAPGTAAGAIAPLGGALELVAPGGSTYRVVVAPHRPRLFGELELPGVPLALLAIALGVSGAVCYFLARYLAAPVDRLRLATRQLA